MAAELVTDATEDGKLDVADLVRMFEESEEATYEARQLAERDRDYVDNKQLTAEEESALKKRGQPPVVINRIKGKIEFLTGMEIERRIDPKAYPRTPKHAQDADGASQALKYATDSERFDKKRTAVWRNMIVEGAGGYDIRVEPDYNNELCVKLQRVPWDRAFWDPHSAEADFSDAGYLGTVTWMDYADALQMYPDKKDALDATMDERGNHSDTYDDKPRWRLWADKKRKRLRVNQIWLVRGKDWYFAEYTKGGILKSGPSPYFTDKGDSDCGLAFGSGYVDRENNRYGIVREMISPQDEVNKRRSKALHLLNTRQIFYEAGAIDDPEKFRKEVMRPDAMGEVAPGAMREGAVKIESNAELAMAQFQLLQESKNEIDLRGPNATMMGEKAQGSSSASGKAIIASQQGGMMEIGELLDNLRDLDLRVFRKVWYRIRQFWTAEKWIRVTDDERNVKWVVMNMPPEQLQMMAAQNPEMAQSIKGYISNIAELDCDIIIDDAPDAVTPQLEQWEAIVELAKSGVPIPPDVLIEMAPNLKDKDKLLERLQEAQQQPQAPDPEIVKAEKLLELKQIESQSTLQLKQAEAQADMEMAERKQQGDMALAVQKAQIDADLARQKAEAEIQLKREIAAADVQIERMKADNQQQIEGEREFTRAKLEEARFNDETRRKDVDGARAEKKETESKKSESQGNEVMAAALSAIAHAIEKSSGPKTIKKNADGSYTSGS